MKYLITALLIGASSSVKFMDDSDDIISQSSHEYFNFNQKKKVEVPFNAAQQARSEQPNVTMWGNTWRRPWP